MSGRPAAVAAAVIAFAAMLVVAAADACADEPYFISVGGGIYDFNRTQVGNGRIELRFADSFLYLRPMLGLLATTDGAVYGYGGLRLDLYLGPRFVLTPNAALG